MHDGKAFVVKPHRLGEILNEADMGAVCLAAPSAYDGKVYAETKEALHCFGSERKVRWYQTDECRIGQDYRTADPSC